MSAESQLPQAQPMSLNSLFNKQAKDLTDAELDFMIAELRKARNLFLQDRAEKKAKREKRKAVVADPAVAQATQEELDSLLS